MAQYDPAILEAPDFKALPPDQQEYIRQRTGKGKVADLPRSNEVPPMQAPGLGAVVVDPAIGAAQEQEIYQRLGATPAAPRPDARLDVRAGAPAAMTKQAAPPAPVLSPEPQLGGVASITPPSAPPQTSTAETIQNLPEDMKKAMVEFMREKGFGKTASVMDFVTPGTWPEIAALGSTFIPGYGQMGTAAKILLPTAAGATAGALGKEGATSGGVTGMLSGVGGKIAEGATTALTGVGKKAYALTNELLDRFNTKFGPGVGKAITESIPSLRAAGVPINNAMDIRNLVTEETRHKLGDLFDPVEQQIKKTVTGTIDMPVEGKIRTSSTTSSGTATNRGNRSTSGTNKSDTLTTTEMLDEITKRTQKEGTSEATAASTGRTASTSQRTGTSQSRGLKVVNTQPMTVDAAIELSKQYRKAAANPENYEARQLYRGAVDAVQQAVEKADPKLAAQFKGLRDDYSKYMDLRDTLKSGDTINKVLPLVEGKGAGLHVGNLAALVHGNPEVFGSPTGRFAPLYNYLGGGAPAGALPSNVNIKALGGYVHIPGFPFSFHQTTSETGARMRPGTVLTPAMAEAMQSHPVIGNLIKKLGLDKVVGGRAGQSVSEAVGN